MKWGVSGSIWQLLTREALNPDPSKAGNLATLISTVQQEGADIGLAYDGDGDRMGVIASDGEIIWPDRVMMLLAMDVLTRNPGAQIIYDVKCSKHLADIIHTLTQG